MTLTLRAPLRAQLATQQTQIATLQEQVAELKQKLRINSHELAILRGEAGADNSL